MHISAHWTTTYSTILIPLENQTLWNINSSIFSRHIYGRFSTTLHNVLSETSIYSLYGIGYEKVSDQGSVWVRSEDKIPGVYISTHNINVGLPECSLDAELSEFV